MFDDEEQKLWRARWAAMNEQERNEHRRAQREASSISNARHRLWTITIGIVAHRGVGLTPPQPA